MIQDVEYLDSKLYIVCPDNSVPLIFPYGKKQQVDYLMVEDRMVASLTKIDGESGLHIGYIDHKQSYLGMSILFDGHVVERHQLGGAYLAHNSVLVWNPSVAGPIELQIFSDWDLVSFLSGRNTDLKFLRASASEVLKTVMQVFDYSEVPPTALGFLASNVYQRLCWFQGVVSV